MLLFYSQRKKIIWDLKENMADMLFCDTHRQNQKHKIIEKLKNFLHAYVVQGSFEMYSIPRLI